MFQFITKPKATICGLMLSTAILCVAATAQAGIITGSSTASGEDVSLSLTPSLGGANLIITSGPLPLASGSSPAAYNFSNTAASATVNGVLSTGVLNVGATYMPAGTSLATAGADATVDGLSVALVDNLLNVLGLSATAVSSDASVVGSAGGPTASGSTLITGLSITGQPAFAASIMPGVNDVVLNALGITVTLNKQVVTNTAGGESIAVDGIDVAFANVLATVGGKTGLLNGNIDIANSEAMLAGSVAVPEPASLAMLGGAIGLLGLVRRRAATPLAR